MIVNQSTSIYLSFGDTVWKYRENQNRLSRCFKIINKVEKEADFSFGEKPETMGPAKHLHISMDLGPQKDSFGIGRYDEGCTPRVVDWPTQVEVGKFWHGYEETDGETMKPQRVLDIVHGWIKWSKKLIQQICIDIEKSIPLCKETKALDQLLSTLRHLITIHNI